MNNLRNLLSKPTIRIAGFVLVIILGQMLIVSGSGWINKVGAEPCPTIFNRSDSSASKCDRDNQDIAQKNGLAEDFTKLRDACEGTNSISGKGWKAIYMSNLDTEVGNCSNAIASCFRHHQNKADCNNAEFIAAISHCNNGNVGSAPSSGGAISLPGTQGCGTEGTASMLKNLGHDVSTNGDYVTNKVNGIAKSECTEANGYRYSNEKTACENKIKSQLDACYRRLGAVDSNNNYGAIDESKLNRCLAESADTKEACASRSGGKGIFVPANPGNATTPSTAARCDIPPDEAVDGEDQKDPDAECLRDGNGNCIGKTFDEVTGECGEARTNIISCDGEGATALGNVLRIAVIILSTVIGVAAVGGLAWASVQYAKAEDNSSAVTEARTLIRNIIIGLFLYGFLIAIVNWLVPGGVIG